MSSHAVYALLKAFKIAKYADIIGALSLEAYDGRIDPFLPQIQAARPHRVRSKQHAISVLYWKGPNSSKKKKHMFRIPTLSVVCHKFTEPVKTVSYMSLLL